MRLGDAHAGTLGRPSTPRHQVVIAKYGTRVGRRSEIYLNYSLYHEPDAEMGMDYFFWLIRGDGHVIVVDTGFSPQGGANRGRTTLMTPDEILRRLAIVPEEVEQVVITHAHYDHIGNLDLFPRATFLIARREYDFWIGPHAKRRQFHHSVEDTELDRLRHLNDAGRVQMYSGRCEVAAGVEVLELGGHTPGQSAVLVQTSEGAVLLASDAVHYYEELERDMPFMSVADLVGMYEAFDTIHDLLATGKVSHLVAGHDPQAIEQFTPVHEPGLENLVVTIG